MVKYDPYIKHDPLFDDSPLDKAVRLQNGLVAKATGASFDGGDEAYKEPRNFFWRASRYEKQASDLPSPMQ
jgi:hypothetical protein